MKALLTFFCMVALAGVAPATAAASYVDQSVAGSEPAPENEDLAGSDSEYSDPDPYGGGCYGSGGPTSALETSMTSSETTSGELASSSESCDAYAYSWRCRVYVSDPWRYGSTTIVGYGRLTCWGTGMAWTKLRVCIQAERWYGLWWETLGCDLVQGRAWIVPLEEHEAAYCKDGTYTYRAIATGYTRSSGSTRYYTRTVQSLNRLRFTCDRGGTTS